MQPPFLSVHSVGLKLYEGWKKTQIAKVHQMGADLVLTITIMQYI